MSSGAAIPDNADYQVVLEPEGTLVGTLNEDFAIESNGGTRSQALVQAESGRQATIAKLRNPATVAHPAPTGTRPGMPPGS